MTYKEAIKVLGYYLKYKGSDELLKEQRHLTRTELIALGVVIGYEELLNQQSP